MHVDLTNWKILPSPSEKNLPLLTVSIAKIITVKNGFGYVLQFFSLISNGLGKGRSFSEGDG